MAEGNGKQLPDRGSCARCEYSHTPKGQSQMQCRRHAPAVLFLGMAEGPLGPVAMTNGFFPPVAPDVWCGEFEPRIGEAFSLSMITMTGGAVAVDLPDVNK